MTDIIIHVGLHKTGTTFLQEEVFSRIKKVNYTGILRYDTKIYKDKINIISDEDLSIRPHLPVNHKDYLNCNQRFVIAKRLHSIFPTAKIIIGIRNKDSWLRSVYSQYVKSGGIYNYDRFICESFDHRFLDFDSYIDYLNDLFNEVLVYRFEDLKQNPFNFVKNICDFIGLDTPRFENRIWEKRWSKRQIKLGLFLNHFFNSSFNPNSGFFFRTRSFNPRYLIDQLNVGENWLRKSFRPKSYDLPNRITSTK